MITVGVLYCSYGVDVVDIFADSRRDSIICQMAVKWYYFLHFSEVASDTWHPFPEHLTVL